MSKHIINILRRFAFWSGGILIMFAWVGASIWMERLFGKAVGLLFWIEGLILLMCIVAEIANKINKEANGET